MNKPKLESAFQRQVKKFLDSLPNSWFFKTREISTSGIPDYIGHIGGLFVALELKRSLDAKSRSRKLQAVTLNKILVTGGYSAFVAPENWDEVRGLLQSIHRRMSSDAKTSDGEYGTSAPRGTAPTIINPSFPETQKVTQLSEYARRKKGLRDRKSS